MATEDLIRDVKTGIRLSINDLAHEWKLTSCLVFAIAGVVAPLLLLFGLKFGTFSTIRNRLVQDPRNREIIPLSTVDYRKGWIKEFSTRPDIAFFVPKTREIAAIIYVRLVDLEIEDGPKEFDYTRLPRLDLVPTADGDVLLNENGAAIPADGECVLTRLAAEKIGAKKGDRIEAIVDRKKSDTYENVSFFLNVIDILPDRAGASEAMFVPLVLADAIESYRDGEAVERYGWSGDAKRADSAFDYVSFRLYARTIDDVEPLRKFFVQHGIDVMTSAYEIERIKSVDRGLTKIFWLVAVVGVSGCVATLAASFASSIERKKRVLGILRTMGFSRWLIFQFPLAQAALIGIGGFVTATAAFFLMSTVINQLFGTDLPRGTGMCTLAPRHFSLALLGTIAVVFFSSVFSAWQATRIDPAEALRDE